MTLPNYMIGATGTFDFTFEFHLLDRNENYLRELKNIPLSGSTTFNSLGRIKRILSIDMIDDGQPIDFLNDRIAIYQVYNNIQTLVPSESLVPSETLVPINGQIKYPLGIFLLSSPSKITTDGVVTYEITCFSKTQLLDVEVTEPFVAFEGDKYTDTIERIFASENITSAIPGSEKLLNRTIDWEIGSNKLDIVNELLNQINYTSLYMDDEGKLTAKPYLKPSDRDIDFEYKDDKISIILDDGFVESLELYNSPNKWVGIASNEKISYRSEYLNENPQSKTSIPSRGRVIPKILRFDDVSDQDTLDNLVIRQAETDSNIYSYIEFNTIAIPLHSYLNKLELEYKEVKHEVIETNWTINFSGVMSHKVRKWVNI